MMPKLSRYIIIIISITLTIVGCTNNGNTKENVRAQVAWQQYNEANKSKDLKRTLVLIDSMELSQIVSKPKADHLRGLAYDQGWQMQIAEHFYKKAYKGYTPKPSQDWGSYTDAGYRWACLRLGRGDTKGALSVITELLPQAKGNDAFPKRTEAALLILMADCQIQLHQFDEAQLTAQKAYEAEQQSAQNKSLQGWNRAWICMNIATIHYKTGDIEGALDWNNRCAEGVALAEQEHDDSLLIEEWKGHVALKRALYLQKSGHAAEAATTYAAIPRSRLFEPKAYAEAAEYLMAAGRYNEAAYWYEQTDSTYIATDGAQMTFDNIVERLSPRYSAYRKTGRNNDALLIADSICSVIDSALVWQKRNDASEPAVIYQTHEKELALNDAKAETRIHRILLCSTFLIILLIGYLLWRSYIYNKVLLEKNRRLLADIEQREQEQQQAIELLKGEPEEQLTAGQQLFRRICDLMESDDHIYTDSELDRSRLAQLLGTNEHYVTDAISACTNGKNVNSFLNEYRLRYAAHLLATTHDSVTLIAELSGFSRSSFFRIFSDAYGMSPSDYRKAACKP